MIEGQRTSRRDLLLIVVMTAMFALGIAACSSGDADAPPTTTNTIAATGTRKEASWQAGLSGPSV